MKMKTALTMVAVALLAVVTAGCAARQPVDSTASSGSGSIGAPSLSRDQASAPQPDNGASGSAGKSAVAPSSEQQASLAPGQLVISTAAMSIEVRNLDQAVVSIRSIAAKYGASISNLSVSSGVDVGPSPQPLDGTSIQSPAPAPGGATITLRVPADKLSAAQKDAATVGRVLSQTSSQDDVTQQHVDLAARLKNLQAEEAQLRTFFRQAKRVSEMLAIEQELARVRGDIESMQAQITYLERQAALATLTVNLSEPGALVSPASGGWGFAGAVRDGVRAAAAVIRGLITTVLAFSPLIVFGLLLWFALRAWLRARRRRRSATSVPSDDSNHFAQEPPASQ